MVEVRRATPASVEAVWNVLADGWTYPSWVVGAARMRRVSEEWPEVGAELHHSVGGWPLLIDDVTRVRASRPHRGLLLRGRISPLGEADIELLLEARDGGGCEIVMREDFVTGPSARLPLPVRIAAIVPRNRETLRRLAYLAEGHAR